MSQNKFSWIVGVGAWGIATAVAFAMYMSWKSEASLVPWLGIALLLFLPGGYMFGHLLWSKLRSGEQQ